MLFNTLISNKKLGSLKGESYIYGIIIKIKVMIKELVNSVKENPIGALANFITTLTIFGFCYVLIFLAAILDGNV